MRNTLLLAAVLVLSSCATKAPESSPQRLPLPEAVTSPPGASTEGVLVKRSQDGYNATLKGLQSYFDQSVRDLLTTLEQARKSPPPTGPAAPSR